MAALSIEITKLSQSAPIEVVARDATEPGDHLRSDAPRRPGRHELAHRREGTRDVDRGDTRRDDQRHLALRSLGEAFGDLGRDTAYDFLEPLRQLATHGNLARRFSPRP